MAQTAPRRRRLEPAPGEAPSGRKGCIVLGAVLGVVVGGTFAFYGLPPILRSIYGEKHVAAGATYRGDAKELRITAVDAGSDRRGQSSDPRFPADEPSISVELAVRTDKTWRPEIGDFRLELTTGGEWVHARAPVAGVPETALDFALSEPRTLLLRFPIPARVDARPKALHLESPRVRFALEEQ